MLEALRVATHAPPLQRPAGMLKLTKTAFLGLQALRNLVALGAFAARVQPPHEVLQRLLQWCGYYAKVRDKLVLDCQRPLMAQVGLAGCFTF